MSKFLKSAGNLLTRICLNPMVFGKVAAEPGEFLVGCPHLVHRYASERRCGKTWDLINN